MWEAHSPVWEFQSISHYYYTTKSMQVKLLPRCGQNFIKWSHTYVKYKYVQAIVSLRN